MPGPFLKGPVSPALKKDKHGGQLFVFALKMHSQFHKCYFNILQQCQKRIQDQSE